MLGEENQVNIKRQAGSQIMQNVNFASISVLRRSFFFFSHMTVFTEKEKTNSLEKVKQCYIPLDRIIQFMLKYLVYIHNPNYVQPTHRPIKVPNLNKP